MKKISVFVRVYGIAFLAGILFSILLFVGINTAMVPVSDSDYCGSECHEMNTAYRSWELSVHGANKYGIRVECVDCHLPPKDKYFTHLAVKIYAGGKDLYKHYLGGEYDIEKVRKEVVDHMPSERCMHCHDSLLAKPSSASRILHSIILKEPNASKHRCVVCHEDVGHQRL